MEHTGFPSDETLAAFIDGKLDADTRRRVIEHMMDCSECYATFLAATEFKTAAPDVHDLAERRAGFQSRRAAAVAAVLAAAAMLVALFAGPIRNLWPRSPLAKLAAAAPAQRRIEARITGFPYKPLVPTTRGHVDPTADSQNWKLYGVAGPIADKAHSDPTVGNLHAYGVSSLLLNRVEQAVNALQDAVRKKTGELEITAAIRRCDDASLLSDLVAAYVEQGKTGGASARSFLLANEAAERAYALDPKSAEVLWNRAVAIEKLHVQSQTIAAWDDYLKLDSKSPWADEARTHKADASVQSESDAWRALQPALRAAVAHDDLQNVTRLIATHLPAASEVLLAIVKNSRRTAADLQLATALGEGIARDSGDLFGRDVLNDPNSPLAMIAEAEALRSRNFEAMANDAARLATDAEAHHYWSIAGRALWLQAFSMGHLGQRFESIAVYRRALALYERAGDSEKAASLHARIAEVETFTGRDEEAWIDRLAALRGLASHRDSGDYYRALSIAADAAKTGKYLGAAKQLMSAAIVGATADVVTRHDALVMRADIQREFGNDAEALKDVQRAAELEAGIPVTAQRARAAAFREQYEALINVRKQPRRALELFASAIHYAETANDRYALPDLHYGKSLALLRTGDTSSATAELRAGVDELERQSSGAALTDETDATAERLYRHLVTRLVEANAVDEAIDYCDRYRRFALHRAAPVAMRVSQAPAAPSDVLTLSYFFADDRLHMFTTRNGRSRVVTVGFGPESIERVLLAGDVSASLEQLSRALLAPVERDVADASIVAVVPDRVLCRIPFAALRLSNGRELAQQAAVVRAPFVRAALGSLNERASDGDALIVGNPDFDRERFPSLETLQSAEDEAREIARQQNVQAIFMRGDATRGNLIRNAPKASLIFIAAHGVKGSEILLAPDRAAADDGVLFARDIVTLRIPQTKLVILSACESGRADKTFTTSSLADSFISAGAHNVIATLTTVDDEEAMKFVTSLHRRLRGGLPVLKAFHETQKEFLRASDGRPKRNLTWAEFELNSSASL